MFNIFFISNQQQPTATEKKNKAKQKLHSLIKRMLLKFKYFSNKNFLLLYKFLFTNIDIRMVINIYFC